MAKKYKLTFRVTEEICLPFQTELFFKGYDSLIYLYERPLWEAYISGRERKQLAKAGLDSYANSGKIEQLLHKGKVLSDKIDKLVSSISKDDLKKKSNKEIENIFKKIYFYTVRHLRVYRYTEVMYSPAIDKIIREFVYDKIKDKDMANYAFTILVNPSFKNQVIQEREMILDLLKPSKRIKNLCQSVRKMGKGKFTLRSCLNRYWEFFILLLTEIARRTYLSPRQVQCCLYGEIIDLLRGKEIDLDAVNQRSKSFAVVKEKGRWVFHVGQKVKRIISQVKPKLSKDIKEFRGDIASTGVVKGRVKILPIGLGKEGRSILRKKISKMKKGDILVAKTTGPEMVMAFKKAGAIIAEEGGINSHAAIISRELGIPGIVNTDIATLVLKDGDLVEVDAYRGVVKILKSAK